MIEMMRHFIFETIGLTQDELFIYMYMVPVILLLFLMIRYFFIPVIRHSNKTNIRLNQIRKKYDDMVKNNEIQEYTINYQNISDVIEVTLYFNNDFPKLIKEPIYNEK